MLPTIFSYSNLFVTFFYCYYLHTRNMTKPIPHRPKILSFPHFAQCNPIKYCEMLKNKILIYHNPLPSNKNCQHTCEIWKEISFKCPMSQSEQDKCPLKYLNNYSDHPLNNSFLVKNIVVKAFWIQSTFLRNCVFHVLQDGPEAHSYQGRETRMQWKRVVSGLCQTQLCYFSELFLRCMFVTNKIASVQGLWQLVTVFQNVWLTCGSELDTSTINSPWCGWMTLSLYVMVIKNIKLIHGQLAGPITACVIASLCLRPWAVSLLGGEYVARWPPQAVPKTDG